MGGDSQRGGAEAGSGRTVEEVALALQDLADLQYPHLSHAWVGRVQDEGLCASVGDPGGQGELTGVAVHAVLKAQTAHLRAWQEGGQR